MGIDKITKRRLRAACVIVGCWTFLALLFTPQTYLVNLRSPTPLTLAQAFLSTLLLFYVWALLTPLVLWLGTRFPLERPALLRNLALHLPLSACVTLVHIWLLQNVNALVLVWSRAYQPPVPLAALFVGLGATDIMVYWGVVAASQALNYFRKYQGREKRLAQAELQVLKMQLHPHFLFNTLNAISELVYSDPKAADRSILRLSELLRFSLASEKSQEVALKKELEFLEKYLEIQKMLMRERLSVKLSVEPDALDATVPNMLLQPLVENSIKHGIAPRPAGGSVEIYARLSDGKLHLEVTDDGLGMNVQDEEIHGGLGLINTRERLKHLYGEAHFFNLSSFPGRGVTIRIQIPFREEVDGHDKDADY
jgi:two-component system LytT family sensor kinase